MNLKKLLMAVFIYSAPAILLAQSQSNSDAIDSKVKKFLNDKRNNWSDWNISYVDGQVLYDLIVENKFTSALEIGTSTGHSTVWLAWALSKTGGKLVTIEIDEERFKTAKANLKKTGLSDYVDFRLADAHQLVKQLEGPFDFVFSDADKDWYKQYFIDVDPHLKAGGCFTAHNVRDNFRGVKEFLTYINGLENYETRIDKTSSSGISISCKKR